MKILSCDVSKFKRERLAALGSGRETDIRMFAGKYGLVLPHNPEDFWMMINKAITECEDFPKRQRDQAEWWVRTFGGTKDAPSS